MSIKDLINQILQEMSRRPSDVDWSHVELLALHIAAEAKLKGGK